MQRFMGHDFGPRLILLGYGDTFWSWAGRTKFKEHLFGCNIAREKSCMSHQNNLLVEEPTLKTRWYLRFKPNLIQNHWNSTCKFCFRLHISWIVQCHFAFTVMKSGSLLIDHRFLLSPKVRVGRTVNVIAGPRNCAVQSDWSAISLTYISSFLWISPLRSHLFWSEYWSQDHSMGCYSVIWAGANYCSE